MIKKKSRYNFLRKYVESIVQIIEDDSLFSSMQLTIYKAIIFISQFQVGIYILQNSSDRVLLDLKIKSAAQIAQLLSLSHILVLKDSYLLSSIIVCFLLSFVYFYFIYIGIFSIFKNKFIQQFEYHQSYFKKINQLMGTYLFLFIYILFNYQIEICMSILVCSGQSLFSQDRSIENNQINNNTCSLDAWKQGLGISGLIMSGINAAVCLYFYRNHQFQDENLLKRKYSFTFVLITILKSLITIVQFSSISESQMLLFKHSLMQLYGLINIFDSTFNQPYQNEELSKFYIKTSSALFCMVLSFNVWVYTTWIKDYELFYMILIFTIVLEVLLLQIFNYRYEKRMQVDVYSQQDALKNLRTFRFDLYISEMVNLAQNSLQSELSKFALQKIFQIHLQGCNQQKCYCNQILTVKKNSKQMEANPNQQTQLQFQQLFLSDDNKTINQEVIYLVADSLFTYSLNQKGILDNQVEYEYLSLQYITFIIKCYKNYAKANFLLKQMIQNIKYRFGNQSIYFQLISNIITQKLESKIGKMNEQFIQQKNKEELNIKHVNLSEDMCNFYIPIIKNVIHEKSEMWAKMQKGFQSMDLFQSEVLKLMQKIEQIKSDFLRQMRKQEKKIDFSCCLAIKKLKLLFYLFILNDSLTAYHLEEEIIELRKRDAFSEKDALTNENLIKKNIVNITISISQNLGMIKSKKDLKTAQFFGYNVQEFQKINKINELMPHFIEKNHDNMIKQFVTRGTSQYIKSFLYSFCVNNKGYVMPVKVYADFSFLSLDDFYIQGIILKVNKGSQYVVFGRSGNIIGITEKLAHKLLIDSDIMKNLPPAEQIMKYLNAFLLFPQIVSKLQKNKKIILQNYEQQHTDIILSSDKGYFYFDSSLISQYQLFSNYLEKKSMLENKNQNNNLEKSNKINEINLLDVLSKDSMKKYHKFIKSQAREKSLQNSSRYTIDQSSKNQSSFLKNKGTIFSTTNNTQSFNTQFMKTIFKIQKQNFQKFFKLSFKYALSYHTLPLVSQFEQNITENSNFCYIQTNQREIYFSLQLDDSQLKENQKQNLNQHENTFQENLANYIMKLSCIPTLQQLNKSILQQGYDEEVLIKEQSSNVDRKIPKSFLKFLDQNIKKYQKKQANLESYSENSNRQKQSKHGIQENVNQTGSYYDTSSSDTESNSENQSFGEDIYNNKAQEGKNVLMQKRISEKFQNIQTKLDDILDENEISVADMLALDSYYKAKRVILQNSNAGNLISALEIAIAEELFQQKKEQQIKSHHNTSQNSSEVSINFQNSINQNEGQITFRNLQSNIKNSKEQNFSKNQRNHFQKQNSDISGLNRSKLKQQSSHTPQLIQDKLEQTPQQSIDAYQENIEYSNIDLYPGEQNSIANISHRFNVSQENLITHNLNQTFRNNQVNISSRPLISQSKEMNSNLLDHTTHASFDGNISPKKQRSFQKQISSVVEKIQDNQNLRQSTPKKQSFINNSTTLAHNYELQNDLKIKFEQNSYLEQDLQNKNLSNLPTNQQIHSTSTHNQQNISDNSKLGAQKKTNISKETHEDFMNNLLNNGGLIEGLGERVSIHSSSRSSISQVGYFLKEIIQKGKVPNGVKIYSILLIIFTLIFIGLNLTNLFIIQNDMQTFSQNSLIIRSPRKLLRNYAKSLYGKYILLQLQTGYLKDTSDNYFQKLGKQYLTKGATDYLGILKLQSTTLIQYLQNYQESQNSTTYPFKLYNTYVQNQVNLELSLFFESIDYYLICNQLNYTQSVQNNCFTTLRANFFNYGTTVVNFVSFVVDIIVTTAANLIIKFTYISIAAIISVVVIPLCALPFAKNINTYEEKILMIVSRIYYSHSQIERQKLHICQQLIQLDDSEWLKYNYLEVFNLRYKMFDHSTINNIEQIQAHQASKRVETFHDKEYGNINSKNQKYSTPSKIQNNRVQIHNQSKQKTQKNSKILANRIVRNVLQGRQNEQIQPQQRLQSNFDSNQIQNRGKDYILQSRIQNSKLSVMKRIQSLLVFMTVAIVYFLIIIIYLNLKSSDLQQPVQINRKTNLLHLYSINYLISSEFLAYDLKLKKIWPSYEINDLKQFLDVMISSLNNIQDKQNTLTKIIYGDNPYSPQVDQIMKNLMEGYVCPYMIINNCTGDLNQLTSFGIKNGVSKFFKIHDSFLNVFDTNETPDNQLQSYLNAQERITTFTNFFKTQDEVFDVFSSTANQSIITVSNGIQQFIQNFLIYSGFVVALLIVTLFTCSTKNIYRKIQLTNLFLIFIPEEKLSEEVTLQMLKNIQKM